MHRDRDQTIGLPRGVETVLPAATRTSDGQTSAASTENAPGALGPSGQTGALRKGLADHPEWVLLTLAAIL